jgi:ubiquinone/menaquinone biosynthesis C-methylase UbiE
MRKIRTWATELTGDSIQFSQRLLPKFRTGHTLYIDYVKKAFRPDSSWLDAGGGKAIFHDLYDGERELVAQSRIVVSVDYDLSALQRHVSVSARVCSDLASLPLKCDSFDIVTCGMVAEHLTRPYNTFRELARVLDRGGQLIIHTVNLWGYPTLLALCSKIIPSRLRRQLISRITARDEEDIFPTHYRCNTVARLSRLLSEAGLKVVLIEYLPSGALFRSFPILNVTEALAMRVLMSHRMRMLRPQLLIVAKKTPI